MTKLPNARKKKLVIRVQLSAIPMVAAVTAEAVETTAVRPSASTIPRLVAKAIIWI